MKPGKLPVTAFAMMRFFLPLPLISTITGLLIWLSVILFPPGYKASGLYIIIRIGVAFLCIAAGSILLKKIIHRVPCQCRECGGRCFAEPKKTGVYICESCKSTQMPIINPPEFLGGIITTAVGLGLIIIWFFYLFGNKKFDGPLWAFLSIPASGLIFFLLGIKLLGVFALLTQRLSRRWEWIKQIDWGIVFGASLCIGSGLLLMAVSFDPGQESSMPSGRWPVFAAGFTFFIAGALIGIKLILRERRLSSYSAMILTTLLLLGFAAVPFFIALHDTKIKKVHHAPIISSLIVLILIALIWYKFLSQRRKNKEK